MTVSKPCTFVGAGSGLSGGRARAGMSGTLLVRGPSRNVQVLPVGQDLPAEAQGRQDDVAPILALRSEGAVDPFIHRLRGRPVSSHHAHVGGHVAGRHQQLASSATHGGS